MNQITRRVAFFIFFVNLLFVQNEVFSASGGTSELQTEAEQQRLQKLQHLEPPNQSGLERGLVWVEGYFLEGVLPNYKGFTPIKGFDDISAPGVARQPDFFRLSSFIIFNYRDVSGNPHRGGVLGFMFTRYKAQILSL
jgi:hypothetical protein